MKEKETDIFGIPKKETDKFGMLADGRAFFNGQNEEIFVDKSVF